MGYIKTNHLSLLIVAYLLVAGFIGGNNQVPGVPDINGMLGAVTARTTITNPWTFRNTVTIGTNGSAITEFKGTIATISGTTDVSHAATTTKYYYASVTGVASGDVVLAQLASTSAAVTAPNGWAIVSAQASSTAGLVDLMIRNLGTAAIVPSAAGGFGSSTNIFFLDN